MPIKKDKRKKKLTLLKQKQKQTQTQKVVINLADLVKKRPRSKPLVEPKEKEPHEMILTRIIREPTFIPPYQHHETQPVKVTKAGLEEPRYIPENYKGLVNPIRVMDKHLLEKLPTAGGLPESYKEEFEYSPLIERFESPQTQKKYRATKAEMEERRRLKELEDELKKAEMERRRENERQLMKKGDYKSQDEE